MTKMNDNFSVYKGKYEYKNSILIPENMIYNSKIDSFNPNGINDFLVVLVDWCFGFNTKFIQKQINFFINSIETNHLKFRHSKTYLFSGFKTVSLRST